MNLYVRYFEREAFFGNVDEALAFLSSIPDIVITPEMEADIRAYANGDVYYPKRYKVRPRIYFIMIKTDAKSMSDFKQKKALRSGGDNTRHENPAVLHLNEEREGWYEGQLTFKRVVLIPATGKHEYRDASWRAARRSPASIATTASSITCASTSTIAASSPRPRARISSSPI